MGLRDSVTERPPAKSCLDSFSSFGGPHGRLQTFILKILLQWMAKVMLGSAKCALHTVFFRYLYTTLFLSQLLLSNHYFTLNSPIQHLLPENPSPKHSIEGDREHQKAKGIWNWATKSQIQIPTMGSEWNTTSPSTMWLYNWYSFDIQLIDRV